MLTKETIIGLVSITETYQLLVREDAVIAEDGVELSRTYHRYVVTPGEDVRERPLIVRDLAGLLWTPEVEAWWEKKRRTDKTLLPIPPV